MPPKTARPDVGMCTARGFSLIELMVVVIIVCILATIAFPSYQHAVRKTKRAEGRAALMQLMQQEERYYSHATTYVSFSSDASEPEQKKFKWYSGDSAAGSSYEITATACENESDTVENCILLTAKPGTGKVNAAYKDPDCGTLMITSTGEKKASGTATDCWR